MNTLNSAKPLSQSRQLPQHSDALMFAKQHFYGKKWSNIPCASGDLQIEFKEALLTYAQLTVTLQCGGFEFDIQIADLASLLDAQATLDPAIPAAMRCASFLYQAKPLLEAFETIFKSPVTILSVDSTIAPLPWTSVIGFKISREIVNLDERRVSWGQLCLRDPKAWINLYRQTKPWLELNQAQNDLNIELTVEFKPIPVSIALFEGLAVGDVLISDIEAKYRQQEFLELRHEADYLPGIQVKRTSEGFEINRLDISLNIFNNKFQFMNENNRTKNMNIDTMNPSSNSLSEGNNPNNFKHLNIGIECELNRVSLSFQQLQQLREGQVLQTHKRIDDESVILKCHGQIIGAGQLVAMGDYLGVRITTLELGAQSISRSLADKVLAELSIK